jgi:hypothetical protein
MNDNCLVAHAIAKETGQLTYAGKPCRFGHDGERYVADKFCVKCRAEGRTWGQQEHPTEGPLARAQGLWIALQQQHPQRPKHRLWPLFLDSIRDDGPVYQAALDHMNPPQPPKPKEQRGFHEALSAWAEKHGVLAIERKVREAVLAGHYGSAAKLRHEALALMRQGSAQVVRTLAMGSSLA